MFSGSSAHFFRPSPKAPPWGCEIGSGTSPEEHLPSLAKPKKKSDSWFKQTPMMLKQARKAKQLRFKFVGGEPNRPQKFGKKAWFWVRKCEVVWAMTLPLVIGIMKKWDIQNRILWSQYHGMVSFMAQPASQILSNNRKTILIQYMIWCNCWFQVEFRHVTYTYFRWVGSYNWRSKVTLSTVFFPGDSGDTTWGMIAQIWEDWPFMAM